MLQDGQIQSNNDAQLDDGIEDIQQSIWTTTWENEHQSNLATTNAVWHDMTCNPGIWGKSLC
jgi:hypothetical protein